MKPTPTALKSIHLNDGKHGLPKPSMDGYGNMQNGIAWPMRSVMDAK